MRFFPLLLLAACAPAFYPKPAPPVESAPAWTPPVTQGPPSGPVVHESCGPIAAAFDDPGLQSFEQARARLDDLDAHPPSGVPKEQVAWCKAQIARLIQTQLAYQENVEGYRVIARIARAFQSAFAASHALCPAARAIPSALPDPAAAVRSKPDEWTSDPGWSCLGFAIDEPQRFQYEVTRAGSSFAIVARRRIGGDVVEIRLNGRLGADAIEFAPNVVESRSAFR